MTDTQISPVAAGLDLWYVQATDNISRVALSRDEAQVKFHYRPRLNQSSLALDNSPAIR